MSISYEGAGIIKVGGKYVLYAAEWNGDMRIDGTYDMMYAVSNSLYGPYSKRRLLIPHGGHGCLFYDREGRLRFTMFGNDRTAPFSRKAGPDPLSAVRNHLRNFRKQLSLFSLQPFPARI